MRFQLTSEFKPTGDQPEAIAALVEGLQQKVPYQTLLGVTGSGKTFTIANVIAQLNKPTLVLSHNKTLAAQLYSEFKGFFPNNAVEYFVSYYDYYQPEAYIPTTDTYIEKDLAINDEIEKLRLAATSSLLSGRNDVIVVSSVSCLYGIGNPEDFSKTIIEVSEGQTMERTASCACWSTASIHAMKPPSSTEVTFGLRGIPWSCSWPITTILYGSSSGAMRSSRSSRSTP